MKEKATSLIAKSALIMILIIRIYSLFTRFVISLIIFELLYEAVAHVSSYCLLETCRPMVNFVHLHQANDNGKNVPSITTNKIFLIIHDTHIQLPLDVDP